MSTASKAPDKIYTKYLTSTNDLGYDNTLVKEPILDDYVFPEDSTTPQATSSFSGGTAPSTITSGEMTGNFNVVQGYLQSSNFVTGVNGWKFDAVGNLEANSGTFRGSLYATVGNIGDWVISTTGLYYDGTGTPSIRTAETVGSGSDGVLIDKDGIKVYDAVLGVVVNLPSDGSAPSFSSGTINETTFEISTNAVLRTSDTVGDGSADSAGVLINNSGIYACEANQLLANANIRILANGSGTFSGELSATSGTIGGWTLGSDKLTGGIITLDSSGNIRAGQTDYDTGTGFWLGMGAALTDSGAASPSSAVNTDSGGDAWSNPTNVYTSNDIYASCSISALGTSDYLDVTNFGFSIPAGVTITGVVVEVEGFGGGGGAIYDETIQIIKGGTAQGADRSNTVVWPNTTNNYRTYGSSSDLWDLTLTDSDINSSDFGLRIQVRNSAGLDIEATYVDHVRITIYYTSASSKLSLGNSSGDKLLWDGSNLTLANPVINGNITGTAGFDAWSSWTPTWTGVTVGDGTLTAKHVQIGRTVHFRLVFLLGSTSSVSSTIRISLPVEANAEYSTQMSPIGVASFLDSGTDIYAGHIEIYTTTTIQLIVHGTGGTYATREIVDDTVPFSWTQSDRFEISGTYEAATNAPGSSPSSSISPSKSPSTSPSISPSPSSSRSPSISPSISPSSS